MHDISSSAYARRTGNKPAVIDLGDLEVGWRIPSRTVMHEAHYTHLLLIKQESSHNNTMGFIGDMQKARQMQQLMKEERATASAGNVTVRVNGSFEVEDISADGDVSLQTLSDVRDAINKAFREVQKGLAAKLSRLA